MLWSPPQAEGFSPNPEEVTEEGQIGWDLGKRDICRASIPDWELKKAQSQHSNSKSI